MNKINKIILIDFKRNMFIKNFKTRKLNINDRPNDPSKQRTKFQCTLCNNRPMPIRLKETIKILIISWGNPRKGNPLQHNSWDEISTHS